MKPSEIQIDDKTTVRIKDIIRIKAWGSYANIWVVDRPTPHLATRPLRFYELALPKFWRVHRSHLVNPAFVVGSISEAGNLTLKNGTLIPVGGARLYAIKRALKLRTNKTDN